MNITSYNTHSFESFKTYVMKIPFLDKETEFNLIENAKSFCKQSRDKLIYHNLKNVFFVLNELKWNKVSEEDLLQEGCIGMIESIDKFDISMDIRFITYSYIYIKQKMMNFIRSNLRIVRIKSTRKNKKIFNNILRLTHDINLYDIKHSDIVNIANQLNVPESDVITAYNFLFFDSQLTKIDDDGNEYDIDSEYLIHNDEVFDTEYFIETIKDKLSLLSEDQQYVIQKYYLDDNPLTLQEISLNMNKSFQAVHGQLKNAVKKLNKELSI